MTQLFDGNQERNALQVSEDSLLHLFAERDSAMQAAREAVRDTTRLTRLMTILNDTGPLPLLLDRGLSTLSELFLADIVVLLDPVGTGSFSPLAAIGLPEDIIRMPFSDEEGSYTKILMNTGEPVLTENVGLDTKIDFRLRELGVETLLGLPVNGNHSVRGVLILGRRCPLPFTEADIGLLKAMAYRIGRTLVDAQRSTQFEIIIQSSREFNRHLDFDAVAAEAVRMFPLVINADASAIILSDSNGDLYCAAQTGLSSPCSTALCQFAQQLIASSSLGKDESFSTDDMTTTLVQLSLDSLHLLPVGALLAVPLHHKDQIHGVLIGIRFSIINYNFGTSRIAVLYAEQISTALQNCRLYQAVLKELAARLQIEKELQTSLAEKEVLLREVHHRVKNNMAAIIGLLDLQRQTMNDPQTQTVMTDLSSRVRAMSLVHEKLYRSESLSKIDFKEYLQSLISHLRTSFGSPRIRFEIEAQGVKMSLDSAVPCGMIVNELIINALKYAFPSERSDLDGEQNSIQVAVNQDQDTFTLSVADNGVGLPFGFDFNTSTSLGLSLVRMLGQHQLGGRYEIDQSDGTRFTLTFSLQDGEKPYA